MKNCAFSELVGKTLSKVEGRKGDDSIHFTTTEGQIFSLYHEQDCCESVYVYDICGEIEDLVGSPIVQAEENSSNDRIADIEGCQHDSFTWTFYRIATAKGQVVIRWLGESNGYYSESVSFGRTE